MKLNTYCLGLSLAALGIGAPIAATAQESLSNEALLKRIQELEQQVKILDRKGEIEREASAEKAKTATLVTAGASGFTIRSADTNFVLKIRGYIQADSRNYLGDRTAVNDTFLLRRVRPILEGTVYEKFDYRLMLDFGSSQSVAASNNGLVQDAYVNARLWPALQIQAGKFKEPVSLERLQSGSNLLFIERGYPSQLAPNRDTGVQLQGDLWNSAFSYAVGAFNGTNDGDSSDFETTDDEKDVALRLFAHPFKNTDIGALQGFGVGVAGTYGDRGGGVRGYRSNSRQPIFSYNGAIAAVPASPGVAAQPAIPAIAADGKQWRLEPQGYYYYGPFGLLGEYILSNQDLRRGARVDAIKNGAWQVATSYFLTGEENSFKAVTPLKPFALGGDGWGAWEVAARVSQLTIDPDAFSLGYANKKTSVSEALSYTLGVNWHLNKNVKLSVNYERTDFKDGNFRNEDVVLTRAQVSF